MSSFGTADDEQLAALARLLDDYSREQGIAGDGPARDELAARIMRLFSGGLESPEDIRRVLDASPIPLMNEKTAA